MTKSLTEQWKDGELEEGLYYIEAGKEHDICVIRNRYCPVLFSPYSEDNTFESEFSPVAPVPSYDEWQESQKKRALWFEEKEKIRNKLEAKIKLLEEKLRIATDALKDVSLSLWDEMECRSCAKEALKEMENVK